jgi:catechol 2,3-dioxygenase-like lactoylglutathione lyase family enzyme
MNDSPTHSIEFGRIAPTLPVTDIDRAVAFYTQKLGMRQTFANGDPVGFVILQKDKAEIHLSLSPDHVASTRNLAHLIVSDAQTLHDYLDASGARIIKGLRDQKYGLRDFIVADPDGNRIDIGQPL